MKKTKNIFLISIAWMILLTILVIIIGMRNNPANFTGTLLKENQAINVEITVNKRKMDKYFKLWKKMKGNILVKSQEEKINYEYRFSNDVYEMENYYAAEEGFKKIIQDTY